MLNRDLHDDEDDELIAVADVWRIVLVEINNFDEGMGEFCVKAGVIGRRARKKGIVRVVGIRCILGTAVVNLRSPIELIRAE